MRFSYSGNRGGRVLTINSYVRGLTWYPCDHLNLRPSVRTYYYFLKFYIFPRKNHLPFLTILGKLIIHRFTFSLVYSGSQKMINDDGFQKALYMIDIGQNDIADAFAKKYSYAQVVKRIPSILAEIKNAIKVSISCFKNLCLAFRKPDNALLHTWQKYLSTNLCICSVFFNSLLIRIDYTRSWWQKLLGSQYWSVRLFASKNVASSTNF